MSDRIVCETLRNVSRLLTESLAREQTADQHERFARSYLEKCYLSKLTENEDQLLERTPQTFAKWRDSELLCYHTNVRLGSCTDFSLTGMLLEEMRVHIRRVLGAMRPEYYRDFGAFSGGATVDTKRGTHFTRKVCKTISCGDNNIIDACYAVGHLAPSTIVPFSYCRASQVPKNNRINRMIAIEPTASMFMQKAIGDLIRRRLKRVGVDLDDQSINQHSAGRAYYDALATIDLSAASDSVSFELVKQVMPADWFRELMKHRSPNMRFNRRLFPLQKFSSMGNGYTFELESLIFWALCRAVCRRDHINVYGDDIIVHQTDAPSVISALRMIGFQVNEEKSFISGDFYESCGKHFFMGADVTPVYQKEPINDIMAAFRCHNRLVRWALRGPSTRFNIIKDALQFLRSKWGYQNHAIPYGVQRDDGWLSDPSLAVYMPNSCSPFSFLKSHLLMGLDENGDYHCRVLVRLEKKAKLGKNLNQIAYFYKLYRQFHQNEDPRGYVAVNTGEVVTETRSVICWSSGLAT